METVTGTPANTIFGTWLRKHKKRWMLVGAVVLVSTYVSKEIVQARLESKIQSVERWRMEARLTEHLVEVEPNLRAELSRGTDRYKRFGDDDATFFLRMGEYPPGFGEPKVTFADLVSIECNGDDKCRVAEWYRRRRVLQRALDQNSQLLEVVGSPWIFNPDGGELQRIETRLKQTLERERNAFGALAPNPTHAATGEFTSAIVIVEQLVKEQNLAIRIYAGEAISGFQKSLRVVNALCGLLFLCGWILSLVGQFYDLGSTPGGG
jgi:hypothetical protein